MRLSCRRRKPTERQNRNHFSFRLRPIPAPCIIAKMAIVDRNSMKTLSAREAKNRFGYLIDTARQEPVSIEKHGRPVVVVVSIEDYERLQTGF
ncbi:MULTISPECIES: type II toxin-antitoxin system Phd/YefM family antitoxin [unclassified Sulfitobacter]|uniref:type II toxin-antitoxin system Phd/YefM family antitoxin n=2 Tax=unclassified Sulfitobacter TaxID=196795 RepID=UPI0031FEA39E